METLKFEVGEFEEGHPWDIEFNRGMYKAILTDSTTMVCKHCKDVETEIMGAGRQPYIGVSFVIPRIVIARNEGGYCITMVCLDCILEAAAKIEGE